MQKNIILFDKQDITRLGMEAVILRIFQNGQRCNITLIDSKITLVQALIKNPDSLVVIDYTLSDLNSVDTLLNISYRFPSTHWILFSEELSIQFLRKVVCNETFSVLFKLADLSEIGKAVSLGLNKQPFISIHINELLTISENKHTQEGNELLTPTETEIVREIALGKSTKEIAVSRNVSTHTVITHRKNIYRKLGVNNSQEATGYALRAGIISFGYCI
jgi:DNA-binding NarL/FixJ family response regulator